MLKMEPKYKYEVYIDGEFAGIMTKPEYVRKYITNNKTCDYMSHKLVPTGIKAPKYRI